jgi:hypothetical protein
MAAGAGMVYMEGENGAPMSPRVSRMIVWSGSLAIAAAAMLTLALNVALGDEVFAARLVAGLTGCL